MTGNKKEIINWLLNTSDDTLIYDIKLHKEKRSLNANNYCWTLIQKIADKLGTTKEELYRQYIKDKGIFRTLEIQNNAVGTITYLWNEKGIGWIYDIIHKGEETTSIILYYGTSSYNTKQMANFIDYVVEEAKQLKIETLTPDEINKIKNEWK